LVVVIVVGWALDGLLVMEEAATVIVVTLDALAINGMETTNNNKTTTAAENKGLTVNSLNFSFLTFMLS
jgi:hypothetical protein